MYQIVLLVLSFAASRARNCLLDEISTGKWIYRSNTTKKAFVCCGWEKDAWLHPDLTSHCSNSDTLNKTIYRYGRLDSLVQIGEHSCFCDAHHGTMTTISEREKYVWVPDSCSLLSWNATHFCEELGDKKIMMIGDSTMSQSATTLMNMIVSDTPRGRCGPQLLFNRMYMPSLHRELAARQLYDFAPDIVVVSFGPHYKNEGHFQSDMEDFLETFAFSYRRNMAPKRIHFVWRKYNAPYVNCDHFQAPADEPSNYTTNYRWDLLEAFDSIALNLTSKYHFQAMDMSPLKLRADAHPGKLANDCFHFCAPGPLNIFSNMMLHMLVEYNSRQHH